MNILKKGLALSIAAVITLTPALTMAEKIEIVPVSEAGVIAEVEQEKEADYIEFSGKITEVYKDGEYKSILVANDNKEGIDELRVYLGDSLLLSDKTMDLVSKDLLKKGVKVSILYHKDTPMGLSLPPVLTPDAIVIRESEEPISVLVSKFDEKLLNDKKDLYILVSDKTNIVDIKGNKMTKEDLFNRDLLVFYSVVMESYPGQTNPDKVIILPKEEAQIEETPVVEVPVEVKEVVLTKELLHVNDKGVTMIPLRSVAEQLGYEVKWNAEARTVEILRGPQWSLITIGKDIYNFARMNIELGTAPVIVNNMTFVPLNFAEQVLIGEVETMDNGSVKIVQK